MGRGLSRGGAQEIPPRRRGDPRGSQLSAAGRGREAARQPEAPRVPAAALPPVRDRHLHPGPEASPSGRDAEEAVTGREAGARAPGEPGQGLGSGWGKRWLLPCPGSCSRRPRPCDPESLGVWVSRGRQSSPMEGFTGPRQS